MSLHARTGITAIDANPVNLTRNARPTDRVVLGGAKQDLYVVVTGWTNMTAATVRLIGTDTSDAAQTEDLAISGDGTYYAARYFKTLTQSQVTVFTKSDSGSFAYEVKQSQWGVVWKLGTNQFKFDCKLCIGDGSTSTYFADTSKQVTFANLNLPGAFYILLFYNATFRLGVVIDSSAKSVGQGCSLIFLESNWHFSISGQGDGYLFLYGCHLSAPNTGYSSMQSFHGGSQLWHNILSGGVCGEGYLGDVYDLSRFNNPNGTGFEGASGTFDRITVLGMLNLVQVYGTGQQVNFKNLFARKNSALMYFYGPSGNPNNHYLINCDSDVWSISDWNLATGKLYRQYEFDLKVTDKDNNSISGSTVVLKDKDGNQVFSVMTDANGNIATQTVSRGYYDRAHGNTLQEYGPHTLTITKAGYQTYVKKFTLANKTVWEIKLAKARQILLDSGRPVLNLKPVDPENQNVMVL